MIDDDFTTIAVVLAVAAVAGLLADRLRQPLIVAFIGVGILVGPVGTGWIEGGDDVDLLARLGIAILLFLVGLRLDLHLVRTTGPVALATGLGQVLFTSAIGFAIARALGMDTTTALYVAVALTFSSTIIIVKLLSDKRELEELHGRIAIGFLIVQDIVVVLVLIVLTAIGERGTGAVGADVLAVLGKGALLLAGVALLMRFAIPRLLQLAARSQELLLMVAVAWLAFVAATTDWLGFSTEVGAFLAGFAVASTPHRDAVAARLVSLRDFLLLFFFLDLGARLEFTDAARQLLDAGVLSAFVLVGNPLIVLVIMGLMRYPTKVGFLAGLTVAQISEFSLVLVSLGLALGHLDQAAVSLVTVVGLVTIGLSTYLILHSHAIYERLAPVLEHLPRRRPTRTSTPLPHAHADVIVFGLGRFGREAVRHLDEAGYDVLAVDFDPHAVAEVSTHVPTMLGDAEDVHLLEALPLARTPVVVSTLAAPSSSLALLHGLRAHRYPGRVVATAHRHRDAAILEAAGVDAVLNPFRDAAGALLRAVRGADEAHGRPRSLSERP